MLVHTDLTETHAQSHLKGNKIFISPHSRQPGLMANWTKAMNIVKKVLINHLLNAFQVGHSHVLKNLDLRSGRDLEYQTTCQKEGVYGILLTNEDSRCRSLTRNLVINRCSKRLCTNFAR